jgi:hypothetical protein
MGYLVREHRNSMLGHEEYPRAMGIVRLRRIRRRWPVGFNGWQRGQWHSPEAVATAVAHHRSGLSEWDSKRSDASDDLLDWRPLGDSL